MKFTNDNIKSKTYFNICRLCWNICGQVSLTHHEISLLILFSMYFLSSYFSFHISHTFTVYTAVHVLYILLAKMIENFLVVAIIYTHSMFSFWKRIKKMDLLPSFCLSVFLCFFLSTLFYAPRAVHSTVHSETFLYI